MAELLLKLRIVLGQSYWRLIRWLVLRPLENTDRPGRRRRLLRRLKQRLAPQRKRKLDVFINSFARHHPRARFIQIGSNDGVMEDPLRRSIRRYPWRGAMVEPVPFIFKKLRANYEGRRELQFFNVAISPDGGALPFYSVDPENAAGEVPEWAVGLGSFSKDMVLSHAERFPQIAEFIVEIEVPCISFETLYTQSGLDGLDLLHIDAEGFDWQILQTVNLAAVRPALIIYERHHLSAADQAACIRRLEEHGYLIMHEGLDSICFNPQQTSDGARLQKTWDALMMFEELYI